MRYSNINLHSGKRGRKVRIVTGVLVWRLGGSYSHVVSHAVFPVDMTVKAMRDVVKVALV